MEERDARLIELLVLALGCVEPGYADKYERARVYLHRFSELGIAPPDDVRQLVDTQVRELRELLRKNADLDYCYCWIEEREQRCGPGCTRPANISHVTITRVK